MSDINKHENDTGDFAAGNMKMYEGKIAQQERKIYDLRNLIGLGISLSSNLNFHSLVESILYSCIGQMFVDKIAILLQEDIDAENFNIHMSKGYDEDYDKNKTVLHEKSPLIQYFLTNPIPARYEVLVKKEELRDDLEHIAMLEPSILLPLKSKDSINGIITLGNKLTGEDFTSGEMDFLEDLGKFSAIAVENSRLYLMATLDRMTRLYIHHYFQERLLEEIKRSQRNGIPLCLIMLDIDYFKKFNDTYGHQQGDIVLKEVAHIFKNQVRSIDIAARYGGEEFAVILPETELEDAISIAKRLRKNVEMYEFSGQKEPLHVTVSLGVAQFNPERDRDNKDFIERTDAALYRAKKAGRNRVVAHKIKNRGNNG